MKIDAIAYQRYLRWRYGLPDDHYWLPMQAVHAWNIAKNQLALDAERRMTGERAIYPEWTEQDVVRGGYTFSVKMETAETSISEEIEGWAKLIYSNRRPQTRDPDVGRIVEGSGYRGGWTTVMLEEDVAQRVAYLRPHYGGPVANEIAVKSVLRDTARIRSFYHGDLYYARVTIGCAELNFNESCGGFESDDDEGMSAWCEEQVQCALNLTHQ